MNPTQIWLSLAITALTIYSIRVTPLLFLRKPITNRFFRSFLYYVPYVTLAVMTFPAILTDAGSLYAGAFALLVGLLTAWFSGDLFVVACSTCAAVFVVQSILGV